MNKKKLELYKTLFYDPNSTACRTLFCVYYLGFQTIIERHEEDFQNIQGACTEKTPLREAAT